MLECYAINIKCFNMEKCHTLIMKQVQNTSNGHL